MRADRRPTTLAKTFLVAAICCTTPGCITAALWDSASDHGCSKPAAVALTPVTLALDATLIAGWIWVEADGGGNECCIAPRRRRCR